MEHVASFRGHSAIRFAVRAALATVVAGSWSVPALAQEPETSASGEAVDEIIVTGSRIRGAVPVGSTVTTVDRQDIELGAPVSTTALLQRLPQVFNLGVSESSRGQSGGSGNITYGSAINLRIDNSASVNNGTIGILSDGSLSTVRISETTVTGNATGLSISNSGVLASYGNNRVNGNGADGAPNQFPGEV